MALDYGYWSALSTGYKSAQDRRAARDADMMKQLQYLQMMEKQEADNLNQKNLIQQQLSTASAYTDKILKNTFGRKKDIDDMKAWHAEHSGWNEIKEIIQRFNGDYSQARLYGNLDYYIDQYKQKINNPNEDPLQGNPILLRAEQNKANLEKFVLAAGSDEDKSRIMPGDSRRFQEFKDGKIDNFQFAGLRTDYDIQGLIDDAGLREQIDIDDIIGANYMSVITDMSNDTGISVEQLQNPSSMPAVKNWFQQATGIGEDQIYQGTKEEEVSYVTLMDKNLTALAPLLIGVATPEGEAPQPMTLNRLLELEKKGISFKDIIEGRDPGTGTAYSDVWEELGGYNASKTPYDKTGGTNVWEGSQLISSGQILTDPSLQTAVMKSIYGDKYNANSSKIYDITMRGLYDEFGTLITDDDIAGTWWERGLHGGATTGATTAAGTAIFNAAPGVGQVAWGVTTAIGTAGGFVAGALGWNPYAENETDDLEYHGTYLGLQIEGIDDMTGDKTSALITYRTSESKVKKMIEQYGNRELKVVMVNELREPDMISDDVYYDVLPMNDMSFRMNMEKNTDSEALSKVYNDSLSYENKIANEKREIENKMRLNQKLANVYTDGDDKVLQEVANTYKSSVGTSLVVGGVSPDKANQSTSMVMSWLLTESEKIAGGDKQKQNEIMQTMTYNLSSNLQSAEYRPMLSALKEGPKQFLNWYSKNTDKETFNEFKIKNKDWAKYFRLNK